MPLSYLVSNAMTQKTGAADEAQNASNAASEAGQGPPAGLPDSAPDFVGEVHSAIDGFVGGSSDALGGVVSEIASHAVVGDAAAALTDVATVIPV